jgi:hypothetical protein
MIYDVSVVLRANPMLRTIVICGLLSVATLAAYWPATGPELQFVHLDDMDYAGENKMVRRGLTAEGISWALTSTNFANWFPVTWLSLMLDAELWGPEPEARGFHITNIVLHIVNTLLLFGVLGAMTGAVWRSALVAALFALHPMHVESVAWISERKDVLSTFFWLLAMATYAAYVRRGMIEWYVATGVCLALGLMSKPMLVTLPCVLLLMDYWPLRRFRILDSGFWIGPREMALHPETQRPPNLNPESKIQNPKSLRRLIIEKLPFLLLVAGSCAITVYVQRSAGAMPDMSRKLMLLNVPVSYVRYLAGLIWPTNLAVLYSFPGAAGCPPWSAWQVAGSVAGLLALSALALWLARRKPYVIVGWLWFLGTLVPVIGLVQVGSQSMADRYTYVPFIGLFIIIAWAAGDLATRWRRLAAPIGAICVAWVFVCGVLTARQVHVWRDTETLYRHALSVTTHNWTIHDYLGGHYMIKNRWPEALEQFHAMLALQPKDADANFKVGYVLASLDRNAEARDRFRMAIEAEPEFADAHFNLAQVLSRQGETSLAAFHLRKAIAHNPAGAAEYRQKLTLP